MIEALAIAAASVGGGLGVVVAILAFRISALSSTLVAVNASLAATQAQRDSLRARAETAEQALASERAARQQADQAALAAEKEAQDAHAIEAEHLSGDDLAHAVDGELREPLPGSVGAGGGAAPAGKPVH